MYKHSQTQQTRQGVCWHSRYNIGDANDFKEPAEFLESIGAKVKDNAILWPKDMIAKPIYLMDHSGLSISTTDFNDRWDSGQIGWIYVTKENVEKEFSSSENWVETAEKMINSEMENENDYISGNVYYYRLSVNGDTSCECGGFYGDTLEKTGILEDAGVKLV